MRNLIIFCIASYQVIISPLLHAVTGNTGGCRYEPTCSEYAKNVINKYGVVKGVSLALRRLSTCHPFAKAT